MTRLTLPLRDVIGETRLSRIVRLDLGDVSFPYRAGQAVRVGAHGQPRLKPYSIACAPEQARRQRALELLVQVGADGDAGEHLPALRPGTLVDVEGPFGSFVFPEEATERRFLFIAGGTGIAPLRAMIWHALDAHADAHLGLLYTARAPDAFAYANELQELARAGRIDLRQTVTRNADETWAGHRGRISLAQVTSMIADVETLCFVCGPTALVADVLPLLGQAGIAPGRIRMEEP